jgi:glycosyltransferase involved in cell wall biosynthesis
MGGVAYVAYHLASEAVLQGIDTTLTSFSNGKDRMRFDLEGVDVRRVRPRPFLRRRRIDFAYAGPLAVLGMRPAHQIAHVHADPFLFRVLRHRYRILHFHGFDYKSTPAFRRAVSRADAIIFCSDYLKFRYTAMVGDPPCPFHVILSGVDLMLYSDAAESGRRLRQELGITSDEFVLLFAGQLSRGKAPHILIEAARQARELTARRIRVLIVGSSTIWRTAGQAAKTTEYEQHLLQQSDPTLVTFLGALPQNKMPSVFGACDVFVFPSMWPEGFGTVIFQAMASGKPVIGSRIGGIPEGVIEGSTGLLVEPGNSDQLALAITALADDPDRSVAFGQAGLAHVQQYSWDRVAGRVRNVYYEVTNRISRRTRSLNGEG